MGPIYTIIPTSLGFITAGA